MHIALVSGFWGQNIGNAFFNLGGRAVLEAAGHTVSFVQDQSAYWTFRNEARGSYPNAFSYVESLDIDVVVLQGPLWTRNFAAIWKDRLAYLAERDIRWAGLGCAFRSYNDSEFEVLADVVRDTPPLFLSTRDSQSYERVVELFPGVRDGIDSAFFMPKAFTPPLPRQRYIAMTFDHYLEPTVDRCDNDLSQWGLKYPQRLNRLARKTKAHAYIAQMLDRRRLPAHLGGRLVVRPEHRTNPHLPFKIYKRPNGIASDEPWTYAGIYAGAEATLSDRVHACVLSLAYGTPAQLHNPSTKRKYLFDRAGVPEIEDRLCQIPQDGLDREFIDACKFISEVTQR